VAHPASLPRHTAAPFLDLNHATKHAVLAHSESLYTELVLLESPVRASVVCPGLIRTRLMECERNRPAASNRDPEHRELSPGGAMITGFLNEGIQGDGNGWPPERVATAAFEAIREERFYVIPAQDEVKDGMFQRIEELREGRNPGTPAMLTEE
jgi:short-subunit dehydrogenase